MALPRKAIISSGLGRFAANDPNAQAHFGPDAQARVKEMLAASVEKANQAGFDVVMVDANPQDPGDTMKRLVETLQGRDFVGVNIGFGLRGHKEHTELFEKMINTAYSLRPGIKIIFSNGPQDIITAIQRNFPENF